MKNLDTNNQSKRSNRTRHDDNPIKRLNETVELKNYDMRTEKECVDILARTLAMININQRYKGFHYIIDAVRIFYRNKYTHLLITKDIYKPLAVLYGTTPELIEHGIRTAIRKGWLQSDPELRLDIYKDLEKNPSNYVFLVNILKYVEDRMEPKSLI
ncbi:MAG: sporulation initiation factor Spo0A C-terminal domain-containing protein [Bacillota bacterium]|nr:sporulation initiation factor Spo0A C-terminal domain-containing protein [Bacillota bacterium]